MIGWRVVAAAIGISAILLLWIIPLLTVLLIFDLFVHALRLTARGLSRLAWQGSQQVGWLMEWAKPYDNHNDNGSKLP